MLKVHGESYGLSSLGSNLGDREANLRAAIGTLPDAGVCVVKVSSLYETEPVDYLDQPWFLNCGGGSGDFACAARLLHALRGIEAQLGSKKGICERAAAFGHGHSALR